MAEIEVTRQGDSFHVVVDDTTTHDVRVPDDYVQRIGLPNVLRTELVRESFVFLLEREPKEAIMRSFELSVIEGYFPEYPLEIVKRLR